MSETISAAFALENIMVADVDLQPIKLQNIYDRLPVDQQQDFADLAVALWMNTDPDAVTKIQTILSNLE